MFWSETFSPRPVLRWEWSFSPSLVNLSAGVSLNSAWSKENSKASRKGLVDLAESWENLEKEFRGYAARGATVSLAGLRCPLGQRWELNFLVMDRQSRLRFELLARKAGRLMSKDPAQDHLIAWIEEVKKRAHREAGEKWLWEAHEKGTHIPTENINNLFMDAMRDRASVFDLFEMSATLCVEQQIMLELASQDRGKAAMWHHLAGRFRSIDDPSARLRADGAEDIYNFVRGGPWTWMVRGGLSDSATQAFRGAAECAGSLLVAGSADPLVTWLDALRKGRINFESQIDGAEVNADGTDGRQHIGGTISRLCEASSELCSQLEAKLRKTSSDVWEPTEVVERWKPDYPRHDFSSREAEACFLKMVRKPEEAMSLLSESAARIFDHWAQPRVELVRRDADIGELMAEFAVFSTNWLTPLRTANLSESEQKAIDNTLAARKLHWNRVAIAKSRGGAEAQAIVSSDAVVSERRSDSFSESGHLTAELQEPRQIETTADCADGSDHRAMVDAFIERCKVSNPPLYITRAHIWGAAGHGSARQFQYWQAADAKKTTAQDALNFARITRMSPAEFRILLDRKRLI